MAEGAFSELWGILGGGGGGCEDAGVETAGGCASLWKDVAMAWIREAVAWGERKIYMAVVWGRTLVPVAWGRTGVAVAWGGELVATTRGGEGVAMT